MFDAKIIPSYPYIPLHFIENILFSNLLTFVKKRPSDFQKSQVDLIEIFSEMHKRVLIQCDGLADMV